MKKIIALAALVAISATASAATNLLVDGSFQDVTQAAHSWGLHKKVVGWTVSAADSFAKGIGLEVRNDVAGTAYAGNIGANFVELDGNENDRITQAFATTIGQEYQVSFWYADRAGVAADSLGFSALVLTGTSLFDAQITTLDKGAFGDNGANWHEAVIDFQAYGPESLFSIAAAGKSDSYGTSFDDFSAVAVPEPATLGLFAAGLAVLGLSARRRRQQ